MLLKISQTKIIYDLLLDGEPHSTYEMVNLIKPDGGLVRISERIREIQKQHRIKINSWPDSNNRCKWWYEIKPIEALEVKFEDMPEYEEYHQAQGILI